MKGASEKSVGPETVPRVGGRGVAQGDIGVAAAQIGQAVRRHDLDPDARMAPAAPRDDRRQQVG